MIPDTSPERTHEVIILVKIISRRSWDELQAWHRACPGSTIEHLYRGMHVLTVPPGGAGMAAA